MSLRKEIAFYFEDTESPISRGIDLAITGLVLLSSVIFVVETYPLSPALKLQLDLVDRGILVIFSIEYLLRLWCADRPWKFIFSPYALLDLLAILPFLLGTVNISFLRIFRWLRILRLIRFLEGQTIFGYVSNQDSAIVVRILFTLFAIIFVYSGLIYQVEHPHNAQAFGTFLDAVYFSVSTVTTAGFGDITPTSQTGRLLTVMMILTGVVLIPWQLGDLIKQLVKTANQVELPCKGCNLAIHDRDAHFCKNCGTPLEKMSLES